MCVPGLNPCANPSTPLLLALDAKNPATMLNHLQKSQRTRVKICGITRPQDALFATQLGADALGLVFYAPSPRAVSVAQAQTITAVLPPFVTVVGLFVDAEPAWVQQVLANVPVDLLQFHGDESPTYCVQFAKPYIKALRMRPDTDMLSFSQQHAQAQAILLDTYVKGVKGGTGISFDWQSIPPNNPKPLILAGGLNPNNVACAIQQVQPYAVDVSGGVEAQKGIKDAQKMTEFFKGIDDDCR